MPSAAAVSGGGCGRAGGGPPEVVQPAERPSAASRSAAADRLPAAPRTVLRLLASAMDLAPALRRGRWRGRRRGDRRDGMFVDEDLFALSLDDDGETVEALQTAEQEASRHQLEEHSLTRFEALKKE